MHQQPISKVTEHRQGLFQRNTRSIHLIPLQVASLRPRTMKKGWVKPQVKSHRTVEPGVPPSETWPTQFVMPVQPTPGEADATTGKK